MSSKQDSNSTYEGLSLEKKDQVAILTIRRPQVYNALTREHKLAMIKLLRQVQKDDDVKVVILTGEGKAFCTGQDLNDRTIQKDKGPIDLGMTLETEWNPLAKIIRENKKIVIAAINGVCAGAGLSVALNCDLVIAQEKTKFVSGFSNIGLCPDAGSTYIFTKALGPKRALEFFLFAQPLMSEDLLSAKLINAISVNPLETALEWAHKIKNMAPLSVSMIKQNIAKAYEESYQSMLDRETACQRFLGNGQDYQEGLSAFFEKRAAHFKGL